MTATRLPFGGVGLAQRDAVRIAPLGRVALQSADLDRRAALVDEDAVALAQDLDRADACAGAAEDVLGEDRRGGRRRVSCRDGGDEAGHVDVGRAADDTRRGCCAATALEATVGLDHGGLGRQRWAQLSRRARRAWSCVEVSIDRVPAAIGVRP